MKRLHTPGRKRYGNNKALLKSRLVTALPVSVSPLFAARVHFSVIPHWITMALGLAGGNRSWKTVRQASPLSNLKPEK